MRSTPVVLVVVLANPAIPPVPNTPAPAPVVKLTLVWVTVVPRSWTVVPRSVTPKSYWVVWVVIVPSPAPAPNPAPAPAPAPNPYWVDVVVVLVVVKVPSPAPTPTPNPSLGFVE